MLPGDALDWSSPAACGGVALEQKKRRAGEANTLPAGLATIRGQTAMMYYDEVPWQGLGQKPDRPATAAEAIKTAQLDWEVEK